MAITLKKLDKVLDEAKRFLSVVEDCRYALSVSGRQFPDSPKHTGAVRRASMDLTRALADLRKTHA